MIKKLVKGSNKVNEHGNIYTSLHYETSVRYMDQVLIQVN